MAMRDFNAHGPHLKKLSNHNIETMTTIDEVYCVPRTVEERAMFPHLLTEEHFGVYFDKDYGELCFDKDEVHHRNLTEIPVPRFLDLLHDRIVPWRLEEIGFDISLRDYHKTVGSAIVSAEDDEVVIWHVNQRIVIPIYITAFTDLMALIRMLTPPTEKP